MSYSDYLETQKFTLPDKGKACIKGHSTFNYKTVVMEADLRLNGLLNGNDPDKALCGCLRPNQIAVSGLIGFWQMWNSNNKTFKFASYDYDHGHRIAIPSTKIACEGTTSSRFQFNHGKDRNTMVCFFVNNIGNNFIAIFDLATNIITYLPTTNPPPSGEWTCIVFDSVGGGGRYLGYDSSSQQLYAFDPDTGSNTLISTAGTSFSSPTDSVVINDTIYLSFDFGNTVSLTCFNRTTGLWLNDITWVGNYVFSGTEFIDATNLHVIGMGLDTVNSTLHLLLGKNNDTRYLGSVTANTLGELETKLSSGMYDIVLAKYVPTDTLEALMYLNP